MRLSDNDGFTLIELMIALVISGIISAAMYSAYTSQQRVNQAQDQIVTIQQDLRAGLDMMARELRMAGYDPDEKGGVGFTVANANKVEFTLVEDDEAGTLKTVSFFLYNGYDDGDRDGDGVATCGNGIDICDIGRQVGSGTSVLIENVDKLEFWYTLVDGSSTSTPDQTDLTDDNIRSIQIFVVVRASEQSQGYLDNGPYLLASGEWTPPPDDSLSHNVRKDSFPQHFRRRMQVITVDCRNMGW